MGLCAGTHFVPIQKNDNMHSAGRWLEAGRETYEMCAGDGIVGCLVLSISPWLTGISDVHRELESIHLQRLQLRLRKGARLKVRYRMQTALNVD